MKDTTRQEIEKQFVSRMKHQHVKYKSKEYYRRQAEFFAGAMAAIYAHTSETPDATWSVSIMSDREIVEPYKI